MSLVLTLERTPQPQAVRQMRLAQGALVIGRAAEADWRIEDPDMYVSRAHCTIAAGPSGFTVTDTSSGGLFLDEAGAPLGLGNTAPLRDGMRLRLGDYVLRVEFDRAPATSASTAAPVSQTPAAQTPAAETPAARNSASQTPAAAAARANGGFDADEFFSAPLDAPKPELRPASLPDPFDRPVSTHRMEEAHARPPLFDDPFTLDPRPTPAPEAVSLGGFDWGAPAHEPSPPPPAPAAAEPEPPRLAVPASADQGDAGRDAFLRGLGVDPSAHPGADMEALGRAHRLMLDGLMHLLRKRAEEKAGVRIAQTVVAGSGVNPLKFMPTADDALEVMLSPRGSSFLDAEAAVSAAIRDLAQHHVSAWRGVQGALARMLDRFDPAALEAELKAVSRVETLLAGGRRAKLWELYEERYREIARSAESRFLGELGADFRDAYEKNGD